MARLGGQPLDGPTVRVRRSLLLIAKAVAQTTAVAPVRAGNDRNLRGMELYFPVSEKERDDLVRGTFDGPELYGSDRLLTPDDGVHEDACWVCLTIPDEQAAQFEDADSGKLDYREFTVPGSVLGSFRDLFRNDPARIPA